MNAARNLLDVLVELTKITPQQAKELRMRALSKGVGLDKIVLESKLVNEKGLVEAKSEQLGIPLIDLGEQAVSPIALSKLPEAAAQRYQVLPFAFSKEKNEISIAFANPLDLEAIEFIEKRSNAKVKSFIALPSQIEEKIAQTYSQSLTDEVKEALGETVSDRREKKESVKVPTRGQVVREQRISNVVNTILEFAMKSRASDVHIEPQEDKTRVRYRIDGIMYERLVLPKEIHDAVISRIKILAGMRIDEKRVPQDGRFSFKADEQEVDLRVSSLPTVHSEKIVMRLLKKGGGLVDLPELGLRGRALKNLEDSVLRPHGIILVCGPTGSGKTTTLYSVLARINTLKVNIITLEDPVEYEIAGVSQVQVNPAAGLTFASGMRSFLRQDPDIIMVGEIRDKETAELAIQASLTGHLVFSTLHTNSAAGALPRLLDLKAEPFLLASSVTCIVGQRVARRICEHCKEEYEPSAEVIEDIKKVLGKLLPEGKKITLFRGKKCSRCNNVGYHGRVGVFEVLPVDEKIARLILERASGREIEKQAVAEGMITMKQDGYLKTLEGASTLEEVIRVAQE